MSIVVCGAIFVGHLCNQNDLAPNYAGILMGITNTPGTISAFILPPIVGALVSEGVSEHFLTPVVELVAINAIKIRQLRTT